MHIPNRIFHQQKHLEANLSCWLLIPSANNTIKLGFDYVYRTQQIREFSTFNINLSLIL